MTTKSDSNKLDWLDGENIRPFVFVRKDNRLGSKKGTRFDVDWFPFKPVYMNPLHMDEVSYADQILNMEWKAFEKSGLGMPRWVFYDCAIMPGFVAGFAHKTESLPKEIKEALDLNSKLEWTPISLFIIIPTMAPGEWVAHNLSSVNSLIPREKRFYGLGFLTKAYGLWHANIRVCCGVTQWRSPAIKLHSHYGAFEILTAYTPVHTYPETLTYRLKVDPKYWTMFFTKQHDDSFYEKFTDTGHLVDPKDKNSLIELQRLIEAGEGPFYLDSKEIRLKKLDEKLKLYRPVAKA